MRIMISILWCEAPPKPLTASFLPLSSRIEPISAFAIRKSGLFLITPARILAGAPPMIPPMLVVMDVM